MQRTMKNDVDPVFTVEELRTDQEEQDIKQRIESLQAQALAQSTEVDVCTFDRGFVRQAIYLCKTCSGSTDPAGRAGICLACSMNCHLDHEIIELHTRRDFRCDCGTAKFICTPQPACLIVRNRNSSEENEDNRYDHNFENRYCYCDGEYNVDEDNMIQCSRCEDWFHDICLSVRFETEDQNLIFFCRMCVGFLTPLIPYLESNRKVGAACSRQSAQLAWQAPNTEMFVSAKSIEQICSCIECTAAFRESGIEYLLYLGAEGNDISDDVDEPRVDLTQPLDPKFDPGAIFMEKIGRLPRASVLNGMSKLQKFTAAIQAGLIELSTRGNVVTQEDVCRIIESITGDPVAERIASQLRLKKRKREGDAT